MTETACREQSSCYAAIIFFLHVTIRLIVHQQAKYDKYTESIEKLEKLREVERKGRIQSQQKSRQLLLADAIDSGFRYEAIGFVESPFPVRFSYVTIPTLLLYLNYRIDVELLDNHY